MALVLAASGSGVASAKPHPSRASVTDRAGDAPTGIDLVSGTYSIARKQARFTAKVTNLTETTFLAFEIWPLTDAWDRLAVYRENGKTVGKVYFVDNGDENSTVPVPHLVKCPGLKVSWQPSRNQVSVTWPSTCLQASRPYTLPFQFHVFSRFGGVKNSKTDALPPRTLDF
jgi:hypothetical protein